MHESGATPSLTTSRHLLSTPHISLCRPLVRLPPTAAFFEAIFWRSALQNLATRQPLHVSIGVSSPRVCQHPAQVSRPPCTTHERCSLRCASAASSCPASKVRCARCSRANPSPPSEAAWSHFAASRTRSFRHADADKNLAVQELRPLQSQGPGELPGREG